MTTAYSTLYHNDIGATKFSCKNNTKEKELLLMKSFWLINNNTPTRNTIKHDIQRVSTLPTRGARKLSRSGFSFDSSLNKIHFNNCQDFVEGKNNSVVTSTPRVRKTSSVLRSIIKESISESIDMEVLDNSSRMRNKVNNNNNNNNNTSVYINGNSFDEHELVSSTPNKKVENGQENENSKEYNHNKRRSSKKVYKHRKHHSDFGITHLQFVDNDEDEEIIEVNNRPRVASYGSLLDDSLQSLTVDDHQRQHSKSDSNLDETMNGGRIKKSNSHVDITTTQMYKDIYADNLRQYGFLLAKQLGLSKRSPDQLRRTYHKSRQRVLERRERANTSANELSRDRNDSPVSDVYHQRDRSSTDLSSNNIFDVYTEAEATARHENSHNLSSTSVLSTSASELRGNKHTVSITDISLLEKHRKSTTVNRRKKGTKLPRDPTKRLSAPLMETFRLSDSEHSVASLRRQLASMSVPDLSQQHLSIPKSESGLENEHHLQNETSSSMKQRKLSDESSKRLMEARARQEFRISRLKSFEGVLSQANTWMRDAKTKQKTDNNGNHSDSEPTKLLENNNYKNATISKMAGGEQQNEFLHFIDKSDI